MSSTDLSSTSAPLPLSESEPAHSTFAALFALSVGSFGIGTGEFAIMGLLPEVARDLGVSIPQAGHVISAYALGVVIGAPVLAVLSARWPRRKLLIALMLFFALGNFASAISPNYLLMNVLRFITGLPHGAFFGVAALVAAGMAAPGKRAAAVAQVLLGLTVATVVGVPLSAWLGEMLGWRAAFVMVGLIGLSAAFLVQRYVPHIPADEAASPWRELKALARGQVWLTLGIGAVGFGGLFAVFSYIKPTLMNVTHMPLGGITLVLSLFGMGMVVGNLVGAKLADKHLMRTVGGILLWALLVMVGFYFAAPYPLPAAVMVFMVGTTGGLATPLQIRLMDVAGDAQTLAAALNHSAFNMANALGAWLGGMTIAAGYGWTSTAWVGAALAVGGLLVFAISLWVQHLQQGSALGKV